MRSRTPALTLILLSLVLGLPAAGEKNPYVERFRQLDRDKDGYVTLPEWPLAEASFHTVDRDKDGRLSRRELLTPNNLRNRPFRSLDLDGDGRLSRPERQRAGAGLDGMDRDKDGYVTPLEYRDGNVNLWKSTTTVQDQQRFQSLDLDRDNRLTRPEWIGAGPAFDQIDSNRDGVISPNEWPRR